MPIAGGLQAQSALVESYKRLRTEDAVPGSNTAYRITVRQLEALVRLSEAIARLHCQPTITPAFVNEVRAARHADPGPARLALPQEHHCPASSPGVLLEYRESCSFPVCAPCAWPQTCLPRAGPQSRQLASGLGFEGSLGPRPRCCRLGGW